jgi:hypothetical protein
MISDHTLGLAIEREIITAEQGERLSALESAATPTEAEPQDEEKLRFVSGFGDIFVTIGLLLFLGSSGYFVLSNSGATVMCGVTAALAWLLAEFFTCRRRQALPSIVLLLVFAASVFATVVSLLPQVLSGSHATIQSGWRNWLVPDATGLSVALAGLVTAAMIALHYWRFKVPITIAAGAGALVAMVLGFARILVPELDAKTISALLFVSGILVFLAAMRFDMSDPERRTRRTDIAFWLHLLAAPLIVHPLINGFLGGVDKSLGSAAALSIIGVFLVLGLIAIIVDRRALLVSGLTYAGIAFGSLLRQSSATSETAPATLLVLGIFVLSLSAGWQPLRRGLLRLLPTEFARRLPHPLTSPST